MVSLAGHVAGLLSATLAALASSCYFRRPIRRRWREIPKCQCPPTHDAGAGCIRHGQRILTAVFFPGIMSPDSINQWQQAVSGNIRTGTRSG
jgi:hypothetical protein